MSQGRTAFAIVCGLALGITASAAPRGQSIPPPRFPARVEVVKLSVLVRGQDGPITALGVADFEVRDNGVRQHLDSASMETAPLRVILAFDVSGSVKGEELSQLKRASMALLDRLRPGDDAALLTFTETLGLRHEFGGDLRRLPAEIADLQAGGGTSLADGVFAAVVLGDRLADSKALILVFTDGQENMSWLPQAEVLQAVKRSEGVIYGIRTGGGAPSFLGNVAATTGGRVLAVSAPARLQQAFVDIVEEFRTRYILRYTPKGVPRTGWHELDVRVKGRSARVLARKGYAVGR